MIDEFDIEPDGEESDSTACAVDLQDKEGRADPETLGFDPESLDRPLLVWDGTCGFCRRSLEHIQERVGDRLHYAPYQQVHRYFDEIDESDFEQAVHLIEPDGTYCSAAEAIFRGLSHDPKGGDSWSWAYVNLPGFRSVTEWGYERVADNRPLVSKLSRWLVGEDLRRDRFRWARWLFLRLLAVVFAIAFVSLGSQIIGLVGAEGIDPAADLMERAGGASEVGFWQLPTIFWWLQPTDAALSGACTLGSILSVGLFLGLWPRLLLPMLWGLYLSLATVSGPFLGYQWDILLLEAAFLAFWLAPSGLWRPRPEGRVGRAGVFLFQWLSFRLVFMSGVVKWLSGDPTWRNGGALTYHFWTQPLPAWTSWYADLTPDLLLRGATWATLALELAVPILLLTTRRLRRWSALLLLGLQLAIMATGNYGFFNLLSIVCLIPLVDDRIWRGLLPAHLVDRLDGGEPAVNWPNWEAWRGRAVVGVAVLVVGVTTVKMYERFTPGRSDNPLGLPGVVQAAVDLPGQFRTLNNYGLFADMTVERPEIILQGRRGKGDWKRYEFRWKPDAPGDRPRFVQPHMPRLDWQLWFQALRLERAHQRVGKCGYSNWFMKFQRRLLTGSPTVEGLLGTNPFPDAPPDQIRTVIYDYRFADPSNEQGDWWRASNRRSYCPAFELRGDRLAPAGS